MPSAIEIGWIQIPIILREFFKTTFTTTSIDAIDAALTFLARDMRNVASFSKAGSPPLNHAVLVVIILFFINLFLN
jgi:hypothetical protein